ncbi:hypothetical protein EZV62_004161 [Acer yangbiense]|uniref:Uncharacterized protein n=1 Tax=Acer yangbiense TaxID=1000413 RepID=A0A5C7IL79_9ROSI|nr:hypothetical protein EZV62_004161 [Acer yangbiense]
MSKRQQHFTNVCIVSSSYITSLSSSSTNADAYPTCMRLPSGCFVLDLPNNCSQVTWIEHSKYDEGAIHNLCCPLVSSCRGFGAQRWVPTYKGNIPMWPHAGIGSNGRKSFLTLAQCMMYNFCSGVCASSLCKWDKLCVESVHENVRVLARRSRIDPGEPPEYEDFLGRLINLCENASSRPHRQGSGYGSLDLHSINMLMSGIDSSTVALLPSGFAIQPDGHTSHGTTRNDNEGSNFNEIT